MHLTPLLHTCHMPRPFHPTNTRWTVQTMQLLIMQFSEVSFQCLILAYFSDSFSYTQVTQHIKWYDYCLMVWLLSAMSWNNEPTGRLSHSSASSTDIHHEKPQVGCLVCGPRDEPRTSWTYITILQFAQHYAVATHFGVGVAVHSFTTPSTSALTAADPAELKRQWHTAARCSRYSSCRTNCWLISSM